MTDRLVDVACELDGRLAAAALGDVEPDEPVAPGVGDRRDAPDRLAAELAEETQAAGAAAETVAARVREFAEERARLEEQTRAAITALGASA